MDGGSAPGGPTLSGVVARAADTLMEGAEGRLRLSRETIEFGRSLAG